MKILHKNLIGLAAVLFSGTIFATCPQVGGHTLSWHNANNTQCTYVANQSNFAASHNPNLCVRGFTLTDANYKVVKCKFSHDAHKCVCSVIKK